MNLFVHHKLIIGSQRLRRSPSCSVSTLEISSKLSSSPRSRSELSTWPRDVTCSRSSTPCLLSPSLSTIVCSPGSSSVSTRLLTPRTRECATLVSWILLVSRSSTWVSHTHKKSCRILNIPFKNQFLIMRLPSLFYYEINAYGYSDIFRIQPQWINSYSLADYFDFN